MRFLQTEPAGGMAVETHSPLPADRSGRSGCSAPSFCKVKDPYFFKQCLLRNRSLHNVEHDEGTLGRYHKARIDTTSLPYWLQEGFSIGTAGSLAGSESCSRRLLVPAFFPHRARKLRQIVPWEISLGSNS